MPYGTRRVTQEGGRREQKAARIKGVTGLLKDVLDKDPATTFVVLDEVELEDWGVGGLPVDAYRRTLELKADK